MAQYYKECQYKNPYGMWQYTSDGSVDGISGRVDCNWCYKDYPAVIKAAGLNGFKQTAPTPQPAPQPAPKPSAGINVGDTVTFMRGAVYASADAVQPASNITSGSYACTVTNVLKNAKHPYHLEGGKVYGWVDVSSVAVDAQGAPTQFKRAIGCG